MSSWEKFSNEIVEGKKKPALDPVGQEDADINNDGKEDETDSYLKNRRKVRSRIIKKEDYEPLEEKAVSKAQQRFFGMVRAAQKGEMEDPSPEVSKAAASMSKSDVKDFAKTKHAKLPEKKETKEEISLVDSILENLQAQRLKRYDKRLKKFVQQGQGKMKVVNKGTSKLASMKARKDAQAAIEADIDKALALDDPKPKSKPKSKPAPGSKAPSTPKANKARRDAEADMAAEKPMSAAEKTLKARQERESRLQKQGDTRAKQKDRELDISQQTLDASREAEASRKKEAAAASKERADQRAAAARENEVKRAKELKSTQIDAKEKQKSAFGDVFKKEVGNAAKSIGNRAASKKDDTGGQAVRSIDTASDAVGGLARGIVGGLMAKRKAKKDRIADVQKQRAINNAGRRAGKEFDKKERAKSDAAGDMADAGLEALTGMKPGQKVKTEKPADKPKPKQIKGTEAKGLLPGTGFTDKGSEQAKSARRPGGKSRAVPFKAPTPPAQRPAIPMGGASPQRKAIAPAKDGSPATSGGARPVAKVSDVVSKPKSGRPFSDKGQSLRGSQNRRAKNKKATELGFGSAKRPKPKGFGEGYSNWRAELNEGFFLREVKPLTNIDVASTQTKLVDISKKKNKIEINPALGEGALPVKPIVGSFAQGEAGKGDSNRTMGDVAKRRIRRKLVDWASQKAGEKAEDIVKNILDKKKEGEEVKEGWSDKYKKSIDCDNPKGFSQKAHCAGKKKEVKEAFKDGEMKPQLKRKKGNIQVVDTGNTLKKSVDNQINTDPDLTLIKKKLKEDWQKVNRKDKTDGLSQKAVDAYRKENPGSKLQTAVTEKKPTGKRADRRKSFCRRMKGMKAKLTSKKTSRDPDSRINKALRRWNCN